MDAPYGTFPVDMALRERYNAVFAFAPSIPLPDTLPLHHPLLEALSGRLVVPDAPGPWWPEAIGPCQEEVQHLLLSVSTQEYRQGSIEDPRFRAFKAENSYLAVHSPRIEELLEMRQITSREILPPWRMLWRDRGSKQTPVWMDLVISTRPEYWINMSNGRGWDTCMAPYKMGDYTRCLPGNFYDLGVAVALLVPHGADVWEKQVVIARTTLRVQHTQEKETIITIGECYHNNRTCAQWLLVSLMKLLEERHLAWGCIFGTNSSSYWEYGHLGSVVPPPITPDLVSTQGDPIFLPPGRHTLPYLDGSAHWVAGSQLGWATVQADVRVPQYLFNSK